MVFGWFTNDSEKKGDEQQQQQRELKLPEEQDERAAPVESPEEIPVKIPTEPGYRSPFQCTAIVTGSSGLCGARMVEMLLERGAGTVVAFDIATPDEVLRKRFEEVQTKTGGKIILKCGKEDGDLTSDDAVERAFKAASDAASDKKIDAVYHIGALVGPFHEKDMYEAVNHQGTVRVIDACRKYKVPKLVFSSSPSTRFTGDDVTGQREDELPFPDQWLELYAETKAYGEMAVCKACTDELRTIAVSPHQIYGPYDNLFLKKILETSGNGNLRVFGRGRNKISVCYVDNYCHGLMCGADALDDAKSPAMGNFYIVTDGEPQYFWDMINEAGMAMGFEDLYSKWHLPVWLLYIAAYVADFVGWLTDTKFKLTPFSVNMMIIHRYFSPVNSARDLKYEPVVPFSKAWPSTIEWFKQNWLPKFLEETGRSSAGDESKKKEE